MQLSSGLTVVRENNRLLWLLLSESRWPADHALYQVYISGPCSSETVLLPCSFTSAAEIGIGAPLSPVDRRNAHTRSSSTVFTRCVYPGYVLSSLQGIGMLPEGTIQATLGLGTDEANKLIDGLPMGVVEGEKECLVKCGLDY